MDIQRSIWLAFEFSAGLHMLRDSLDNIAKQGPIPVNCWIAGTRFEIKHYPEISCGTVEAWSDTGKLIHQFRINLNTKRGISAFTGKPVTRESEATLSPWPKITWYTESNHVTVQRKYRLIMGKLSNAAFRNMVIEAIPWLK